MGKNIPFGNFKPNLSKNEQEIKKEFNELIPLGNVIGLSRKEKVEFKNEYGQTIT